LENVRKQFAQSRNLTVKEPGIEPTISHLQVRRPNHYITKQQTKPKKILHSDKHKHVNATKIHFYGGANMSVGGVMAVNYRQVKLHHKSSITPKYSSLRIIFG